MLNKNKIVFGFCGYAGVGKDTAFKELVKFAPTALFQRVAFADKLKLDTKGCEEVLASFGFTPETDPLYKEKFRDLWIAWSVVAKRFDPLFWVKRVEADIREWGRRKHKVCITDVRYDYELAFIEKQLKGLVIFIDRPGFQPNNDEEYRSFSAILKNYPEVYANRIINDGTPEELGKKILDRLLNVYDFELPKIAKCSKCGRELHQHIVTCSKCGANICTKCSIYNATEASFRCEECPR